MYYYRIQDRIVVSSELLENTIQVSEAEAIETAKQYIASIIPHILQKPMKIYGVWTLHRWIR